jgi:hypothetical protein
VYAARAVQLLLTRRYLLAFALASGLTALAVGIPTNLLPNPWFQRMTPVRALDVVLWPLISLSVGALLATYALPRSRPDGLAAAAAAGCSAPSPSAARSATSWSWRCWGSPGRLPTSSRSSPRSARPRWRSQPSR